MLFTPILFFFLRRTKLNHSLLETIFHESVMLSISCWKPCIFHHTKWEKVFVMNSLFRVPADGHNEHSSLSCYHNTMSSFDFSGSVFWLLVAHFGAPWLFFNKLIWFCIVAIFDTIKNEYIVNNCHVKKTPQKTKSSYTNGFCPHNNVELIVRHYCDHCCNSDINFWH